MDDNKLPADPICDGLLWLALAFFESIGVAPLEEKYKLASGRWVVVTLNLHELKIQAFEFTMIAVQVSLGTLMWLEKEAIIRSLTIDMQLSFCTLARRQGLKVDALVAINETPTFVIRLQDTNGGVLYRFRNWIESCHTKRKGQAIRVGEIGAVEAIPLADHDISFIESQQLDRLQGSVETDGDN